MMRSFMERFLFQYLRYTMKDPSLAPQGKAVAMVYTMNVKEQDLEKWGMDRSIKATRMFLQRAFGGSELFLCSDTKQMDDYSRYEMEYMDPAAKDRRHAEVFPQDLQRAFEFGAKLARA